MKPTGKWRIQDGKGKSTYRDRWTFDADKRTQAVAWYNGINNHSGHKKRLIDPDGKVVSRVLT